MSQLRRSLWAFTLHGSRALIAHTVHGIIRGKAQRVGMEPPWPKTFRWNIQAHCLVAIRRHKLQPRMYFMFTSCIPISLNTGNRNNISFSYLDYVFRIITVTARELSFCFEAPSTDDGGSWGYLWNLSRACTVECFTIQNQAIHCCKT